MGIKTGKLNTALAVKAYEEDVVIDWESTKIIRNISMQHRWQHSRGFGGRKKKGKHECN